MAQVAGYLTLEESWACHRSSRDATVAQHTEKMLPRDEAHYEGKDTDRVRAPMLLGRMGRRLAEIAASDVQRRSLDLYARLAEMAR